jgi:hypothetical protein
LIVCLQNNASRLTRPRGLGQAPELQIQVVWQTYRNVQSPNASIHVSKRVVHASAKADCLHVLSPRMIDETDILTSIHGRVMVPIMVVRLMAPLEMSEAMDVPRIVIVTSQ